MGSVEDKLRAKLLREPTHEEIPVGLAVVARFEDTDWQVRKEALKTLGKLKPATLVEHAKDVAFCLNDSSAVVRRQASETLRKLEPPQYAVAVSAWLVHSQKHVREAALETLGKLALATLAPHLNAVVAMRCDTHAHVREKAMRLSGRLRWYRCRLRLLCVERLALYWYALPYRPSGPGHARDVAAWDRMHETRGQTPRLQPPEQSGAEADESTSSESLAAPTWTCHRCRYQNYGIIRCALCGSPKEQPAAGPHETTRARKRRR